MPTVLRVGRYRFLFFSNENNEPPHIHIKADRDQAKFWLDPVDLIGDRSKAHEFFTKSRDFHGKSLISDKV